jgi:integrase
MTQIVSSTSDSDTAQSMRVEAMLRRWQTELRNIGVSVQGHDPIFPTRRGRPHSHANILERGWYPAPKRAGVYDWKTNTGKAVRFHDLRRTAVSLMRDLGVTEGDNSATTGHSIAVMRAVYSHPLPKERRGGTDAIPEALGTGAKSATEPSRKAAVSP